MPRRAVWYDDGPTTYDDGVNTLEIGGVGEFGSVATLPPTGEEGYVYILQSDGHAYTWHDATGWEDLGQFLAPPGEAADKTYVHTQGAVSAVWIVAHNLSKYVSVEVVDSGDSVVWPDVRYDSLNQVTLTFANPTSGKAYVN